MASRDGGRLEWPTYMNILRKEMWDSVRQARAAARRWQIRDAELKTKHPAFADYRTAKKADQICADELSTYQWHRDNANYLAQVIAAEIEIRRWNNGAIRPDNQIPLGTGRRDPDDQFAGAAGG